MDKEEIKKIDDLKLKKKEIDKEIRIIRQSSKKNNGDNNSNELIRVSHKFELELDDIVKKRLEIDKENLSKPKITELIVRHNSWPRTKEDIIAYELGGNGKKSKF